ncbi:hypothetical protein HPP92_008461 [Vanilla planifolia]|uniref:Uncharacterized protein n=1 Tax=Vanilla planifolia TaxID=51239 RepID=A0A835RDP3_VANPL|nr:hypothetical protein HPP92_008627 [Vanilla planifolia]KAG0486366.1 hypothetical protein HPP92_008461 [Vanilla planifolia]
MSSLLIVSFRSIIFVLIPFQEKGFRQTDDIGCSLIAIEDITVNTFPFVRNIANFLNILERVDIFSQNSLPFVLNFGDPNMLALLSPFTESSSASASGRLDLHALAVLGYRCNNL